MAEMIAVDRIVPNPRQPRKAFDPAYIAGLAGSIQTRGLIQPISVRPIKPKGMFMIIAGECRWRAHCHLKRKTIKANVEDIDEREMQKRAVVENLQRKDMNPLEEANAFQSLMEDNDLDVRGVASELSLGADMIQNRLNLLRLTPGIQQLVASGNIGAAVGSAISWAPFEHQLRIVREYAAGKIKTVEQVRHAAIALRDAAEQTDAFGDMPKASAADLRSLSRLEERIDQCAAMVAAGFSEGECVAAQRVSPDRVKVMADKLALIRKHIFSMEHQLRLVATQTELLLPAE